MAQYNLFLTEQERTKMKLIQINLNLKSANAVFQYLISEYKIKVTDEGFDEPKWNSLYRGKNKIPYW